MRFALICQDRAGSRQLRLDTRAAHLEHIRSSGVVEMAGPFLDEGGAMIGSLIILSVTSLTEARAWADADPYAKAGLFESVIVREWHRTIG